MVVSDIAPHSITLTWTAPGDDGKFGRAFQYDIRYAEEPITEATWEQAIKCEGGPEPQLPGSIQSFVVTGLLSGKSYYFAMRTADEAGNWSSLSNVATIGYGGKTVEVPEGLLIRHGPNPVSPEGCVFWLNLPDDAVEATLKVFDVDGALLVSIPLDPEADRYPETGRWIPQGSQGRLLGTGLYLYCVEIKHADGTVTYSPVQKMVIQR